MTVTLNLIPTASAEPISDLPFFGGTSSASPTLRQPRMTRIHTDPTRDVRSVLKKEMKPNAILERTLGAFFAALILGWSSSLQSAPPTLVVFLSDDHGQLDATPYGATDVRTPNMQRLAEAGMTFTRAFVASPACAPSRAALLTGLMPARNGVRYWISWFDAAKTDAEAAAVVRRYHERPARELYHLRVDPFEQQNLAAEPSQAGRVRVLRDRLEAWMREQGDRQTVFKEPRLLSDSASTQPGEHSGTDNPNRNRSGTP